MKTWKRALQWTMCEGTQESRKSALTLQKLEWREEQRSERCKLFGRWCLYLPTGTLGLGLGFWAVVLHSKIMSVCCIQLSLKYNNTRHADHHPPRAFRSDELSTWLPFLSLFLHFCACNICLQLVLYQNPQKHFFYSDCNHKEWMLFFRQIKKFTTFCQYFWELDLQSYSLLTAA
jgi:hypothetical protein